MKYNLLENRPADLIFHSINADEMSHIFQATSARTSWSFGISFAHGSVLKNDIREVRALEYHFVCLSKGSVISSQVTISKTAKSQDFRRFRHLYFSKNVDCILFSPCFPEQRYATISQLQYMEYTHSRV